MEATMSRNGHFTVKRVKVEAGPFEYWTYRLTGWLQGRRIRRQYQSADEAAGARNRYEVEAANARNDVRTVHTRLNGSQLGEAESAFRRLDGQSLSFAVDWFLANYRPPTNPTALSLAVETFTAVHMPQVSFYVQRDYKRELAALLAAFPGREVHAVTTEDVHAYLTARNVGKKAWNNLRGLLHAFFEFCRVAPRQWCADNPVRPLVKHKIARGIPEILTAAKVAELMAYLETYPSGTRQTQQPGYLVPYFALCVFAGIRPTLPKGEAWKIGKLPPAQLARAIDLPNGVIRISPDISKTRDLRQITIQPNLRAWLERYPPDRYPIAVPAMQNKAMAVRIKFGLTDDVLRHTFISMHVAKFKSLGAAALEAGNSESILRRHYLNLVTEAEAAVFWNILPVAC